MSKLLAKNMGTIDRAVRAVAGVGLLSLTVVGPQTMWGLIGLVPLLTAATGSCPAYSLIGLRTNKAEGPTGAA